MRVELTALESDLLELAVQQHCCHRNLEYLEEEEDTPVVVEQRRQNEVSIRRLQSLMVFRRAPHRTMPLACVRQRPTPRASRASRRTSRRSAHGPPGRRASSDDEPAEPPPLARFGHLRLLVDAYIRPSSVGARIARDLERERPR